jgi:hypothetical protein
MPRGSEESDESSLEEFEVELDSGEEWHSDPIKLRKGEVATLTCTSDGRFYADIVPREEYVKRKGAAGGSFDFCSVRTDTPSLRNSEFARRTLTTSSSEWESSVTRRQSLYASRSTEIWKAPRKLRNQPPLFPGLAFPQGPDEALAFFGGSADHSAVPLGSSSPRTEFMP